MAMTPEGGLSPSPSNSADSSGKLSLFFLLILNYVNEKI